MGAWPVTSLPIQSLPYAVFQTQHPLDASAVPQATEELCQPTSGTGRPLNLALHQDEPASFTFRPCVVRGDWDVNLLHYGCWWSDKRGRHRPPPSFIHRAGQGDGGGSVVMHEHAECKIGAQVRTPSNTGSYHVGLPPAVPRRSASSPQSRGQEEAPLNYGSQT